MPFTIHGYNYFAKAKGWTELLLKAHDYAKTIELEVIDSDSLDPYYKGDLNGTKYGPAPG